MSYNNVAIGYGALTENIGSSPNWDSNNTAVGVNALSATTTGVWNTAVGLNALIYNTIGYHNTAIGLQAGINNTYDGPSNSIACTFVGMNTFASSDNLQKSTAIGFSATITQSNQIVLGTTSEKVFIPTNLQIGGDFNANTRTNALDVSGAITSSGNISVGGTGYIGGVTFANGNVSAKTIFINDPLINNINIGETSNNLTSFTSTLASYNIALGSSNLGSLTSGKNNISIGEKANNCATSGSHNIAIGYQTGNDENSTNLSGVSNSIAIGYQARWTDSYQIILGNTYHTTIIAGDLTVSKTVKATTFNAQSDYRLKQNIKQINLDEYSVDKLNPVAYELKQGNQESFGFIAHELQEHFPCLVSGTKDGENMQSVNYIGLIAILTKEIQVLKQDNASLMQRLDRIESLLNI